MLLQRRLINFRVLFLFRSRADLCFVSEKANLRQFIRDPEQRGGDVSHGELGADHHRAGGRKPSGRGCLMFRLGQIGISGAALSCWWTHKHPHTEAKRQLSAVYCFRY